jgi:hypothetical protein
VHLVAEEADAARLAELHQGLERGVVRHRAGRVVREVDRDEPGAGPQGPLQPVQIQDPALLRLERQSGHLRARGHGEGLDGLVAGHGEEDVVPGAGRLLEEPEEPFLGAGEGEDVLGPQRRVGGGDGLPQLIPAPGGDVAQRDPLEGGPVLVRAQRQQLAEAHALGVGGRQHVPGGELPPAEEHLEAKIGKPVHGVTFFGLQPKGQ